MIAVLLGVFAALSWSLHDLVARVYSQRLGPMRMALAVIVTGGLLLTPFAFAGGLSSISLTAVGLSLLLGVAYAGGIGGLFKALSLGPISLVGPFTATYPALVVAWNVANGVIPTALQWLAIAAALAGAVIVSRAGHADGGINAVAKKDVAKLFAACAISMLCYAASVVIGQKAGALAGEYPATWISRFSAALVLLPLMRGETPAERLAPKHLIGILAMGLFDIMGQIAVNMTGTMPGHEYTAIGIASIGATSAILAALILKERVSAAQWCGIALIVGGVAGVSAG